MARDRANGLFWENAERGRDDVRYSVHGQGAQKPEETKKQKQKPIKSLPSLPRG